MNVNFDAALAFVWATGRDSPADGYHVTPGDAGGGTFGGVTEATWLGAVRSCIVRPGPLSGASTDQLSTVLRTCFWDGACDTIADGVDLLLFNGRMMSGHFGELFQQALGFMGSDVDGWLGPETLKAVRASDAATLINAISGTHAAYLATLSSWREFGDGWIARLRAAQALSVKLADATTTAAPVASAG